jgi:hypothetical protein
MMLVNSTKTIVRFVFLSDKIRQGSSAMRAHQLSNMVRPFVSDGFDIELESIDVPSKYLPRSLAYPIALKRWAKRQPANSILIFTKACLQTLSAPVMEILRSRNIKICFDHVDSDFRATTPFLPDVHICTSYAQFDAIKLHQMSHPEFGGKAMVLLHNYDESLLKLPPAQQEEFRCAYIGTPSVGYLPSKVTQRIEVETTLGVDGWQAALNRLPRYSFHYCLRLPQPAGSRLVKPFTKGFVAAKFGAPVIVNRQTDDAETMLGKDYPYMVDELDERIVLEVLEMARLDFGGPAWKLAQDRMASVAAAVSPQALAKQLESILRYLKD